MAGHSHWAGIKHKKAAQDAKRGKVFSKIARAIIAAARTGGGDPATNLSLRYAIDKARAANMPRDNIERAIKKGSGELKGEEIVELTYEGYGPGGAGVLVQAITENTNRTGPEVRRIIEKRGGTLGKPGSVAWNFEKKALLTVSGDAVEEDVLMETALEAGADDVTNEGDAFAVTGPPDTFGTLMAAFERKGIPAATSEVVFVPKSRVMLAAADARRMIEIIEALEDHDDVQSAITNADLPDEVLAELKA
jgi:YebC/PmpR family DNA-binding regulatory protein